MSERPSNLNRNIILTALFATLSIAGISFWKLTSVQDQQLSQTKDGNLKPKNENEKVKVLANKKIEEKSTEFKFEQAKENPNQDNLNKDSQSTLIDDLSDSSIQTSREYNSNFSFWRVKLARNQDESLAGRRTVRQGNQTKYSEVVKNLNSNGIVVALNQGIVLNKVKYGELYFFGFDNSINQKNIGSIVSSFGDLTESAIISKPENFNNPNLSSNYLKVSITFKSYFPIPQINKEEVLKIINQTYGSSFNLENIKYIPNNRELVMIYPYVQAKDVLHNVDSINNKISKIISDRVLLNGNSMANIFAINSLSNPNRINSYKPNISQKELKEKYNQLSFGKISAESIIVLDFDEFLKK
jgi:hypothetical protein